jgi:hypothetical protein
MKLYYVLIICFISCKKEPISPQGNIIFYSSDQNNSYSVNFKGYGIKALKYKQSRPGCDLDHPEFYTVQEIEGKYPCDVYKNGTLIKHDTLYLKPTECQAYDAALFNLFL